MVSTKQVLVNLLALGLFHMFEQKLAACFRGHEYSNPLPGDGVKLGATLKWLKDSFSADLESCKAWPLLDELRILANTLKHAEINATAKLRERKEELFANPEVARFAELSGSNWVFVPKPVVDPISGEDLFVSAEHFVDYQNATVDSLRELADFFDQLREAQFRRQLDGIPGIVRLPKPPLEV